MLVEKVQIRPVAEGWQGKWVWNHCCTLKSKNPFTFGMGKKKVF